MSASSSKDDSINSSLISNNNNIISTPSTSSSLKRRSKTLFQCEVCEQQAEFLIRCDDCFLRNECGTPLCYHITCAPLANISFERRSANPKLIAICDYHRHYLGGIF